MALRVGVLHCRPSRDRLYFLAEQPLPGDPAFYDILDLVLIIVMAARWLIARKLGTLWQMIIYWMTSCSFQGLYPCVSTNMSKIRAIQINLHQLIQEAKEVLEVNGYPLRHD